MRVPETITGDKNLFIDECESISSLPRQESNNRQPSPHPEHIYAKIVKAIGNRKSNDDKSSLKRASWSPAEHQECGLPPTGKRVDGDQSIMTKTSTRVRMRSRPARNYQLQQPHQIPPTRPVSFNERCERLSNQPLNRHRSLSNHRREQSPSMDTLRQITKPVSPSFDNSDTSSVTTTTSQHINPPVDHIYSPTTKRPLLGAYQLKDSDYKISPSILKPLSSPISSAFFTCQKGEEKLLPSSPKGSSLNQYPQLTLQTASIDSARDEHCHPTTHHLMTMSTSPNQTTILNRDQTDSAILPSGCLKSNKTNRTKKSVHFDCHSPIEIPLTTSVTVTSSSLSTDDNDSETVKEKERTRRTVMTKTTNPLTTHLIHRSFSLSPSPLSKEENNHQRQRQELKKDYVDELNSTTSRRVTFNNYKKSHASENLTQQMPLNSLLVKTSSFNTQTSPKKCPTSNGFLNFMTRSNSTSSNHSKPSSSIQRKSRQSHNKRLSTDDELLSNEDMNKVRRNHQYPREDNNIIDSSKTMIRTFVQSTESDSIHNAFLFQPVQSIIKEPFYLSASKPTEDSSRMQTSTLVISTPPQYHYYLYPPSIAKKNSTTNISMNSISTNSSSSSSSYDLDDDTLSYSTYSIQNQVQPIILSDSVQNFWPPPPSPATLNNDPEQIIMASTVEQNKQSQSNHTYRSIYCIGFNCRSSTYIDDSLSMSNGNQTDVLPPPTSLMLNNNDEEVRSYFDQSSFSNECLRIASDSSLEDTQASYSERLREKSRSIKRPVAMNINSCSLSRSRSKDNLNQQLENFNGTNRNTLRPKSAGQVRAHALLSPIRQEISNDFQSKRQFFENRTYTDHVPPPTNNRMHTNSPVNQQQRHVTKCSWNDLSSRQLPPPHQPESMIRTTKYFDSLSNQVSLPPTVYRKPVRVVKAVQRSAPSPTINDFKSSFPIKMNVENINQINPSSQYMRNLFPMPDRLKRNRSRQNSENNDVRTMSNDSTRQTEDLLFNLKKRLEIFTDNQRIINDEIEINTTLGTKLIKIIESKAELNEIEKLKLHINEIETITSVLLKLSCRLAKVENDLSTLTNDNAHTKASLLEQREKIQQKHDEAKFLKDGIDRRSRLVTIILRKYLTDEQFDDYEHFIRMKSTLLMDAKDMEENILFLQKQIQILLHFDNSSANHVDHLQTNYCKPISTTA